MTALSPRDRVLILEAIARADDCASRRDTEAYLALFTTDAALSGDQGEAAGPDALRAQLALVWSREPASTVHLTSGAFADAGDAPGTAVATSHLLLVDPTTGTIAGVARVQHHLVNREGAWLFTQRRVEMTP